MNFNSFGETFFSEGTHFFPKNISEEQCYENAKKDAIKNIMNKAGYSYLSNRENLICAEVKGNDICEYFEDVQISYDNGFLKSKEFSNKQIINDKKCNLNFANFKWVSLIYPMIHLPNDRAEECSMHTDYLYTGFKGTRIAWLPFTDYEYPGIVKKNNILANVESG